MIDWNRVYELRQEVGDEEFQPILALFLDEVEAIMRRLPVDGPDELETDLHFLKGSAWSVGFKGLGEACEAAELLAQQGWQGRPAISRIQSIYTASRQSLLAGLAQLTLGPGNLAQPA